MSSLNNKVSNVSQELDENQQPLGTQFKSYELNKAINFYTLDPFQYSITKFDYRLPGNPTISGANTLAVDPSDFKNNPGLVYRDTDFEKLLPSFTQTKKSVNDFPAQSYHRFLAGNGYFNPQESVNNTDLWYYGADDISRINGIGAAGPSVNVQEVNHIIFPEAQRGGLNSNNLAKYSWSNYTQNNTGSWESENNQIVNNNVNCEFFNFNSNNRSHQPFDSNYCRSIGISAPYSGSMPFN